MSINSNIPIVPGGTATIVSDAVSPSSTQPESVKSFPLETGKTYSAQVSKSSSTPNNPEGIIINKEFYAVEIPNNVAHGSTVAVKVLAISPELKVEFLKNESLESQQNTQTNEQIKKQIEQILKTLSQARNSITSIELPEKVLTDILNAKNLHTIINLDKIATNPLRLQNTLININTNQLEQAKAWLATFKEVNQNQEQSRTVSNQILQLLDKHAASEPEVAKDIAKQQGQLSHTLKTHVDLLSLKSKSAEVLEVLLGKLEQQTPESLIKETSLMLTKKLEELPSLTKEVTKTLNDLVKSIVVKESFSAPELNKEVHSFISDSLKALDAKAGAMDFKSYRQIKTLVLTIYAHLNNAELEAGSNTNSSKEAQQIVQQISQAAKANNFTINSELLDALKNISKGTGISDKYSKMLLDLINVQSQSPDLITKTYQRFNEIINSNSLELIVKSLEGLVQQAVSSDSMLHKAIGEFAAKMLEQLNLSQATPILERAITVQELLKQISDSSLNFLERLHLDAEQIKKQIEPQGLIEKQLKQLVALVKNTLLELEHSVEGLLSHDEKKMGSETSLFAGKILKAAELLKLEINGKSDPLSKELAQILEKFQLDWKNINKETASSTLKPLLQNLFSKLEEISERVTAGRTAMNSQLAMSSKFTEFLSKLFAESSARGGFAEPKPVTSNEATQDFMKLLNQINSSKTSTTQSQTALPGEQQKALAMLSQLLNSLASGKAIPNQQTSSNNEFLAFIQVIKQLQFSSTLQNGSVEQILSSVVNQHVAEIEKVLAQGPEKQVQLLQKIANQVRQELSQSTFIGPKAEQSQNILKALNSLETMLRGQEAVMQMAPLLKAAGDPIFMLFPMLMQGILSKLEMIHYPPGSGSKVQDEAQQHKKKQGRGAPRRTQLNLKLPKLGQINVDLSYTDQDVFCSFKLSNSQAIKKVAQSLPLLEIAFSKAGYSNVNCQVHQVEEGCLSLNFNFSIASLAVV